jgi:glyoxylase-like metal-dependent hydrolase (beta-lactamase superfamily II)
MMAPCDEPQSPLAFPLGDTLPEAGQCLPVAEGVFWLRLPLPFALNHINLWLLQDGDGWTLVDCGYGSEHSRALWQPLLDGLLAQQPLRRIIVTHDHPDHIGLADWLMQQTGAQLWMSESEFLAAHAVWHDLAGFECAQMVEMYRRHAVPQPMLDLLAANGSQYRKGVPSLPGSFNRLLPGDTLSINGREWHTIVGYGHSPEHMCLYCPSLDLLISGDMLLSSISSNISVWATEPDGNPLRLFLDSLARLAPLPSHTRVLPSHGRPFVGIQLRIDWLRWHHQQRLDALLAFCAIPKTAVDVLPVLFDRDLDAYQLFFAVGEATAHLNYWWRAGQLAREQDQSGVYRFVRVL